MTEQPNQRWGRRRGRVDGRVELARFREVDMRQLARERLRQDVSLANAPDSYIESIIDDSGAKEPWISPPGGGL